MKNLEREQQILMTEHAFKLKGIMERVKNIRKIRREKKLKKWLVAHKN